MAAQATGGTPKPSRSQFIEKLHTLLENPLDSSALRWVGEDAFEITCNDQRARHALSPSWEFRSLSSFIRQLSYYNFKRLSDRRRSSERRTAASGYIVFSHPSGLFVQGDPTRLAGIVRKTRNRPDKSGSRRNSTSSVNQVQNDEDVLPNHPLQTGPVPAWPHVDPAANRLPNLANDYPGDRRQLQNFSTSGVPPPGPFQSNFSSIRNITNGEHQPGGWRGYSPPPLPQGWNEGGRMVARRPSDYGAPPPLSPKGKLFDPTGLRDRYPSSYPPPPLHSHFPSYPIYPPGEMVEQPYAPYLPYSNSNRGLGGANGAGGGGSPTGSYHSGGHSPDEASRAGDLRLQRSPLSAPGQAQFPLHLRHQSLDSQQLPPLHSPSSRQLSGADELSHLQGSSQQRSYSLPQPQQLGAPHYFGGPLPSSLGAQGPSAGIGAGATNGGGLSNNGGSGGGTSWTGGLPPISGVSPQRAMLPMESPTEETYRQFVPTSNGAVLPSHSLSFSEYQN